MEQVQVMNKIETFYGYSQTYGISSLKDSYKHLVSCYVYNINNKKFGVDTDNIPYSLILQGDGFGEPISYGR